MEKNDIKNVLIKSNLDLKEEKINELISKNYIASPDFIHRQVGGTDILISVGGNIAKLNGYIQLNSTASVLWDKLKEECSIKDLIEIIEKEFDGTFENIVVDVVEFIQLLKEHQMVKVI